MQIRMRLEGNTPLEEESIQILFELKDVALPLLDGGLGGPAVPARPRLVHVH